MQLFDLNFYIKHKLWVGIFAMVACVVAWSVELTGIVYVCPYCRVQRSVIGLLGLMLILPFARHWIMKFLGTVIGFFGAVVAANQNFMGWKKISSGTFSFRENLAIDPFILSSLAMVFIFFLLLLLHAPKAMSQD